MVLSQPFELLLLFSNLYLIMNHKWEQYDFAPVYTWQGHVKVKLNYLQHNFFFVSVMEEMEILRLI